MLECGPVPGSHLDIEEEEEIIGLPDVDKEKISRKHIMTSEEVLATGGQKRRMLYIIDGRKTNLSGLYASKTR